MSNGSGNRMPTRWNPNKIPEYTQEIDKLPGEGINPSTLLSFNAADELVYADDTINGDVYRTTFTRSDMTVARTLQISEVVKL